METMEKSRYRTMNSQTKKDRSVEMCPNHFFNGILYAPLSYPMDLITAGSSIFCFSFRLNRGLIDEHDGNIFFDRVDPVALDTLKALLIRGEFDVGFA
jgi:hypothetical protein